MGLLRVREVASEVGVHELTVRRWIAEERLAAVRLGSGPRAPIRVPSDSLVRFLATATVAAAPDPIKGQSS